MGLWNKYLAWQEKKARQKETDLERKLRKADKAAEKAMKKRKNIPDIIDTSKDTDLQNG